MKQIDPNIIGLIGDKLQKNKKFMKKVWKDQGGKIVTCDPKSGE